MSSEIVAGDQSPATPIFWRKISSVELSLSRSGRSEGELESIRKLDQARREAFTEGVAAGRQQAEEQIRPAMEGLAQTLAELSRLRTSIQERAAQDTVHLAVSIAARVIHREVAVDPDALGGLVQAAIGKLQAREVSRVRMHPALERLVRKAFEQTGHASNLTLVGDPSLKSGELRFETSQGILDASVETQLLEIERGLIDKLEA